jgi:hypothetical protein
MQILLDMQDILTPEHEHGPFHERHERLDREVANKEMFKTTLVYAVRSHWPCSRYTAQNDPRP